MEIYHMDTESWLTLSQANFVSSMRVDGDTEKNMGKVPRAILEQHSLVFGRMDCRTGVRSTSRMALDNWDTGRTAEFQSWIRLYSHTSQRGGH